MLTQSLVSHIYTSISSSPKTIMCNCIIVLGEILKKQDGAFCTGFSWHRIGTETVCCGNGIVALGHPDTCWISGIAEQALAAEGGSSSIH